MASARDEGQVAPRRVRCRRGGAVAAKPRTTVVRASRQARSSSPAGRMGNVAPRSSAFASPSIIALTSRAASRTDLRPSRPAPWMRRTFAWSCANARARLDQVRSGLQSGHDPLERDAVERRVVAHQPAKHRRSHVEEVGDRILGFGLRFDLAVKELERGLGESSDEALLRAEHAGRPPGSLCRRGRRRHGRRARRGRPRRRVARLPRAGRSGSARVVPLGPAHP